MLLSHFGQGLSQVFKLSELLDVLLPKPQNNRGGKVTKVTKVTKGTKVAKGTKETKGRKGRKGTKVTCSIPRP